MSAIKPTRIVWCVLSMAATSLALGAVSYNLARAAPVPPPAPGQTIRLNVADPGSSDNPDLSDDGRYVVFESASAVLTAGDTNGSTDIFIRDTTSATTQLLSLVHGSSTTQGSGSSRLPAISASGDVVAFLSDAKNLTADPYTITPGFLNIFVRVRSTLETIRINAPGGLEPDASAALVPVGISSDGAYVLFTSYATNLTPAVSITQTTTGGQPMAHLYLWGPRTAPVLRMVDVGPSDTAACFIEPPYNSGSLASTSAAVSSDGDYVAFSSLCQDLVSPPLVQGNAQVFRWQKDSGVVELVTKDVSGNPISAFDGASTGSLSANGCFISFASVSNDLVVSDNNGKQDTFLWDCLSATPNKIERVSLANGGVIELNGDSTPGYVSSGGRYVSFASTASNAVLGDSNNSCDNDNDGVYNENCPDVFVRDRTTSATVRVSVATDGWQLSLGVGFNFEMTPDTRYFAVVSDSPDLGTNNDVVFLRDDIANTTALASVPYEDPEADEDSYHATLSNAGRYVAFASDADNLAYGAYTQTQVFVRDLTLGSYRVMSVNGFTRANGFSGNPSLSGDALCWVAFESDASNLIISGTYGVADTNGVRDILIKSCEGAGPYRVSVERQSPTQYIQAVAANRNPVFSRNAEAVVFESDDTQLVGSPVITNPSAPQLYLADVNRLFTSGSILIRVSGATDYSNGSNVHPVISADGECVAWASNATNNLLSNNPPNSDTHRIYYSLLDLPTHTVITATRLSPISSHADYPALSADCRYVAWVEQETLTATYQLKFYDGVSGVFETLDTDVTTSHAPAISDNGRFVTYCSQDSGTGTDVVYSYDRALRQRWLASRTASGAVPNGGFSCVLDRGGSATDSGRFLVYSSEATDLVADDANGFFDIFGSTISATEVSTITFATPSFTVTKGAGIAPIVVARAGPTNLPAQVDFTYVNVTDADYLVDYTVYTPSPLQFAVGEVSKTITVGIGSDYNPSSPPTIIVHFSLAAVQTATIGSPYAIDLTILNPAPEPITGLSASNSSPTPVGSPTYFTATVASGNYISYTWAFGDGTFGVGEVVSHTYASLGDYVAVVTATNPVSNDSANTPVNVYEEAITGLIAHSDSPTLINTPTTLSATVTAGTNVVYAWQFGDGNIALGQIVTHTYPAVELYTATVQATNSLGNVTASTVISITAVPLTQTITFDPLPNKIVVDPPFVITATASSGLPVSFSAAGLCSVAGNVVTLLDVGSCSITASQPGTVTWNPAPDVTRTFQILDEVFNVYLPFLRKGVESP